MTDYLGPLSFGSDSASGTYCLTKWSCDGATADLELIVRGTTADTLATYMEALIAQLRVGNSYAHYQPGNTYPVVYTVLGVSGFKMDALESWHAFWQRVTFTLNLAGMPAGALTTLYNAQDVLAPASVSLAALLGTNPTPLDVTIDDASGNDMHSVVCALAPTALSDAKWLKLAASLTWTGSIYAFTNAGLWGNYGWYMTSATYATTTIDTAQYPAGKYRLYARAFITSGTGYIKDSQNDVEVPITGDTYKLWAIGDLDLPTADTAPGTAANITISCKSDGAAYLNLNGFVLIPLEYGFFSWQHATPATEIDQLDVGPSGIYMDGITDLTYFNGGVLVPKVLTAQTGTLNATVSPSGNTWPSDWGRTSDSDITADTGRFKIATTSGDPFAYYSGTAGAPLVIPGAWYELSFTRQVTARSAGSAYAAIFWLDVDGNQVYWQTLDSISATDAAPVVVTGYAKAPMHAARAWAVVGSGGGANLTAYYSNVELRRCPMRLIVVALDSAGTLVSYAHPVHLTLKYTAKYEVAR